MVKVFRFWKLKTVMVIEKVMDIEKSEGLSGQILLLRRKAEFTGLPSILCHPYIAHFQTSKILRDSLRKKMKLNTT